MKCNNRIVIGIIIFLPLFFSCSTQSESQVNKNQDKLEVKHLIEPRQFKDLMYNENVVILDVRTPGEVAEGVIGGPAVINFQGENFNKKIIALDKSKTYLVYCKSGGRSGKTKALMDSNGFKTVYDLKGGITAWKADGMPIE